MQMTAYLAFWRLPPPKFTHCHRMQAMAVGILQQLRSCTFPGTGRRQLATGFFENFRQSLFLAKRIMHTKAIEQLPLKCSRSPMTLFPQCICLCLYSAESLLQMGDFLIEPNFHPAQFSFLKATFIVETMQLLYRSTFPSLIAASFRLSHSAFEARDLRFPLPANMFERVAQRHRFRRGFQSGYIMVDG